ncbi:PRC-barrel domain-containing protein [Patulibacter minatonensis]|uniref:PRC-barrel domain-containing protein n=1 Tax=Patulibacter minatonensis TaxID=298163 RepID=UPI0012FB3A36|nr:PRC-barrel domain-containing protein [Patulibacter minatonensis]
MLNRAQVEHWPGRSIIDRSGSPLGTIKAVFADPAGHPAWATVRSGGRWSRRIRFVPISDAEQVPTGVVVPFTAAQVEGAPDADRNGNLTAGERRALHAHYGLRDDATLPAPDRAPSADAPAPGASRGTDAPAARGSRGDGPPADRAEDRSPPADPAGDDATPTGPAAGRDVDRPTPPPADPAKDDAGPPPALPAPSGPADLDELPTFDPDSPAVGDPEDPRFDPPGGRKAPRRRGPGEPDGDVLEPPADDHGPLAAAGPAEDPLLSDDPAPPEPEGWTPDGPGTGHPADRVVGDPSDPRGGDPDDDPVFPADLPDFPGPHGDDPDDRG